MQVANDPWLINVLPQTSENCLAAVKADGMTLRFIKPENQTEEICLAAVIQHGYALQYVAKQTINIVRAAVENNGFAAKFIDHVLLDKATIDEIVIINSNCAHWLELDEDQWFKVIIKNNKLINILPTKYNTPAFIARLITAQPNLISKIDQTPELCRLAITNNPGVWGACKYQPADLVEYVYNHDPKMALKETHTCSQEFFILQTREDPRFAAFVEPNLIKQIKMVKNNPLTLRFMQKILPDTSRFAVMFDPKNIKYIQDQTLELQAFVLELDPESKKYFVPIKTSSIEDKIPDSASLRQMSDVIVSAPGLSVDEKVKHLKKLLQY